MDTNTINSNICEAIETIVQSELDKRSYDTTIIAVITDDSKRADGAYTVSDGSVKFEAYAESPEYRTGDQVLVSIQQGDWRLAKTIIRKYSANNDEDPVAYVPPLGTMLSMTDNLAKYGKWQIADYPPVGILANGPITQKCIWAVNLNELDQLDLQNNEIYSVIGLRASFRTLFGAHDYDIREGRYGLRLQIDYVSNPGAELQQSGTMEFVLDSKADMFGDPYNFLTYFSQEKKIDISKLGTITQLRLFLYQTGNFAYFDGEHREFQELPHTYEMNGETRLLPDNILVKDVEVMFGHDLLKMEDNTLQIYTHQNNYYSANNEEDQNKKDIYLLWCNKTEENEYIGFSDGIYDPDYDEDTFREEYEAQMKGMTLKAQDLQGNIPQISEALQMYSNADLLNTYYKKLSDYINASLYNLYRTLRQNLFAYSLPDNLINELVPYVIATNNNKSFELSSTLKSLGNSVADIINDKGNDVVPGSVVEIYRTWLDLVGTNVYDKLVVEAEPIWPDYTTTSQFETFLNDIQRYWESIISVTEENYKKILRNFDAQKNDISLIIQYPNIKALVETSEVNWKIVKKNVQATIDYIFKVHGQQDSLEQRLKTRFLVDKNLQSIDEEYSTFMDNHANRYCIYWYRYDRNYTSTDDRYMGTHWQRMTEYNNCGRPSEEDELNPGYLVWRCADAENSLRDILMNVLLEKEQFRAVLFYNHEAVYSNILEFENKENVIDTTTGSLSDQIFIELGDYASESFQLYGVNNCLINAQDSRKQRFLRVRYHGLDEQDSALIGTRVFWYMPLSATMLFQNEDEMVKMGFSKLESKMAPEAQSFAGIYLDGYNCYYKNINPITDSSGDIILDADGLPQLNEQDTYFSFHVKDYYNATSTNNTIICRVIKNDLMLEDDQPFAFTTFGTSGTDFTIGIYPATIQAAVENGPGWTKPLPLKIDFFDYNHEQIKDPYSLTVEWNKTSGNYIAINPDTTDYYIIDDLTQDYVKAIAPYTDDKTYFVLNSKTGEYQQVPYEQVGVYTLAGNPSESSGLYNILEANIPYQQLSGATKADQTIKLRAYYPVAIATGDYYIEGASWVIYDSMGQNPSYYKEPYKIFNIADHSEITGVTWSLEWYKRNGTGIQMSRATSGIPTAYLPTIVYTTRTFIDTGEQITGYYLNPLDMFVGGIDYYPVAVCRKGGSLLWAQPIIIEQNRYGSPMLNKWDEQLYIDEESGYILARMIGAGYKNENNRFHGVIMGDARPAFGGTGGDNSITTTGLFGFHDGAQSFGIMETGKMFLGKSGHGRIELDGNNGIIRSANYHKSRYALTQYERDQVVTEGAENTNTESGRGMMIDLEAGWIDAANFQLTSDWLVLDYHGTKRPKFRPFLWIASDNLHRTDVSTLNNDIVQEQIAEGRFQDGRAFPLIEVTNESFYLQSINFIWNETNQNLRQGMKIDLYEGKIWCWNFKLNTSYLVMDSSGYPYFAIFDLDNNSRYPDFYEPVKNSTPFFSSDTSDTIGFESAQEHIFMDPTSKENPNGDEGHSAGYYRKYAFFWAGEDRFYFQSVNFSHWNKTGFKIDLFNGEDTNPKYVPGIYAYSGFDLDAPYPYHEDDPTTGAVANSYWKTYLENRNTLFAGNVVSEEVYRNMGSPPVTNSYKNYHPNRVPYAQDAEEEYWPEAKEIKPLFSWQYKLGTGGQSIEYEREYSLSDEYKQKVATPEGKEEIDRLMKFNSRRVYINSMAKPDENVIEVGFGFSVKWNGKITATGLNIAGGEITLGDPDAYFKFRPSLNMNTGNPYPGFFKVNRYGRLDATCGHLGGWEHNWVSPGGNAWTGNIDGARYALYSSEKHWAYFNRHYQTTFDNKPHMYLDSMGCLYARGYPVLTTNKRTITLSGSCKAGPYNGSCSVTLIIGEGGDFGSGIFVTDGAYTPGELPDYISKMTQASEKTVPTG